MGIEGAGGVGSGYIAPPTVARSESNEDQLVRKVRDYVERHHHGDYQAAFRSFDTNRDLGISRDELVALLDRVGFQARGPLGISVSNRTAAGHVIDAMDRDGDSRVQWEEFQRKMEASAPAGTSGALRRP